MFQSMESYFVKCLGCLEDIPIDQLREHHKKCISSNNEEVNFLLKHSVSSQMLTFMTGLFQSVQGGHFFFTLLVSLQCVDTLMSVR